MKRLPDNLRYLEIGKVHEAAALATLGVDVRPVPIDVIGGGGLTIDSVHRKKRWVYDSRAPVHGYGRRETVCAVELLQDYRHGKLLGKAPAHPWFWMVTASSNHITLQQHLATGKSCVGAMVEPTVTAIANLDLAMTGSDFFPYQYDLEGPETGKYSVPPKPKHMARVNDPVKITALMTAGYEPMWQMTQFREQENTVTMFFGFASSLELQQMAAVCRYIGGPDTPPQSDSRAWCVVMVAQFITNVMHLLNGIENLNYRAILTAPAGWDRSNPAAKSRAAAFHADNLEKQMDDNVRFLGKE